MHHGKGLAMYFWDEAIKTACHIVNQVYLRPVIDKTPYEIWNGKKLTIKYFRVLGRKCYILRNRKKLSKFDTKSDQETFLGYSRNSRAYHVYNSCTFVMMESINFVIDDALSE